MCRHIIAVACALCLVSSLFAQSKLSLNNYGWRNARNGAQRAKVLFDAQTDAVKKNTTVDYSGIKKIDLEITEEFQTIPLTGQDDFCGIEFIVKNNTKDVFLFSLIKKAKTIEVDKRLLDGKCFKSIPMLCEGEYLLVIKDKNLWVDNRVGYSYGHTRKDILLIKDGISQNRVVASYNNQQSDPECEVIKIISPQCRVANFRLTRSPESKYKTYCLRIKGVAHLSIEGVVVNTPESDLASDKAINIVDCADVTLKDVTINGTYSQDNKYGYGININNAWHTNMVNVQGGAKWGVLGNNNLNDTYLTHCQLNRFDLHCYGKNVFLSDCIFDGGSHGWNCGGSSIYGIVKYDRCSFFRCIPFSMGDSYKTAVGVDVVFNDCFFYVTTNKKSICRTRVLNDNINHRSGLSKKCLPNIEINNMTINVPKGVSEIYLYNVGEVLYSESVGYLQNVKINGLTINCESPDQSVNLKFIDTVIKTDKRIKVDVSDLQAPAANIMPVISSNRHNNVKIANSSFCSIERSRYVRLKTKKCTLQE